MAKPALIGQRRSLAADRDALRASASATLERIRRDEDRVRVKLKPWWLHRRPPLLARAHRRPAQAGLRHPRQLGGPALPPRGRPAAPRLPSRGRASRSPSPSDAAVEPAGLAGQRAARLLQHPGLQPRLFQLTGRRPLSVRKEDRSGGGEHPADELEPIYEETLPSSTTCCGGSPATELTTPKRAS